MIQVGNSWQERAQMSHLAALEGFPESAHSFGIAHPSQGLPGEQTKTQAWTLGPFPPTAASGSPFTLNHNGNKWNGGGICIR